MKKKKFVDCHGAVAARGPRVSAGGRARAAFHSVGPRARAPGPLPSVVRARLRVVYAYNNMSLSRVRRVVFFMYIYLRFNIKNKKKNIRTPLPRRV